MSLPIAICKPLRKLALAPRHGDGPRQWLTVEHSIPSSGDQCCRTGDGRLKVAGAPVYECCCTIGLVCSTPG
jgi:hypothetical protein